MSKQVDKHQVNLNEQKKVAEDDAFPGRYYQWPLFRINDAIQAHKETHDPTMYDALHMPLNISVEMNMIGEKKTRLVSNFQKLVKIQYPFEHGQKRSLLVFAKEEVSSKYSKN